LVHGSTERLIVANCIQTGDQNGLDVLTRQLAPHLRRVGAGHPRRPQTRQPFSILLVEHLESANPAVVRGLVAALDAGQMMLPDGDYGSLAGCLVLMTTDLCAHEIYETGRKEIGFSSGSADLEESEKASIYRLCVGAAEKAWGSEFLAHLDDLIVFHRLAEPHLPLILRRLLAEMEQRLASREIGCRLGPAAEAFLVARAALFLHQGAWGLLKVFRRFVVFPIADLVHSGRVEAGGRIHIDLDGGDRLKFTVLRDDAVPGTAVAADTDPLPIPVAWQE